MQRVKAILDSSVTNSVAAAGPDAHDAAAAGNPVMHAGYAKATAPTAVSADGDVVRAWHLLNGSYVCNLAAGSTLILSGNGTAAGALRVTLASDGTGVVGLNAGSNTIGTVNITDISAGEYETVAAGAVDQVMGGSGAIGDYLAGLLIIPATTSPGAVTIKDGGGSAITVFTGGASSVSNLVPFYIPLGIKSTAGAWKVTTGTNVSAIGVGNFSA